MIHLLFAILQKYDFSSKSQRTCGMLLAAPCCLRYCKSTIFQANHNTAVANRTRPRVVCDTAKVRFFKQITTIREYLAFLEVLFAILQKYDFSSKSQRRMYWLTCLRGCLRYCKSTIFQANHNIVSTLHLVTLVVCDTAKVRFFKQITTFTTRTQATTPLFAILQKYDFSSKSQPQKPFETKKVRCLRYCKSTIFQANHNTALQSIPVE